MQDNNASLGQDIEIGVNPHAEVEQLYDKFCNELDPIGNQQFVRRLARLDAGQWKSLDALCENLTEVPDHAREIIDTYPGRFVLCHLPWIGAHSDKNQPDCFILAGDIVSMYHRAMLMHLSLTSAPEKNR